LPGFDYSAPNVRYFLTISADPGTAPFSQPWIAELIVINLLKLDQLKRLRINCYCLMPDHMHLLALSLPGMKHLSQAIKDFERFITGRVRQVQPQLTLWQGGYYDHILREDEADDLIIGYIMRNPVEAALTREVGEWPYAKIVIQAEDAKRLTPAERALARPASDPIGPGLYIIMGL